MSVTVQFDNPTGQQVSVRSPRKNFDIPAYAVGDKATVVEFAETPEAERCIQNIVTRHPAIKAVIVDEAGGKLPLPPLDKGAGGVGDVKEEKEIMELDAFAELATSEKGKGGWWAVTVKGFEKPFKVRSAGDHDGAVLMAYEEYCKPQKDGE